MKVFVKYLIGVLLCVPFSLKAQDVKFDITLKGNTLNYTVVNDTPKSVFLVRYNKFNEESTLHCVLYYKDKDGYVDEISFALTDRIFFLIKPGARFSCDFDISEIDRQKLVEISGRATIVAEDEQGTSGIRNLDKSITF